MIHCESFRFGSSIDNDVESNFSPAEMSDGSGAPNFGKPPGENDPSGSQRVCYM